jgi:four helix bundle protein
MMIMARQFIAKHQELQVYELAFEMAVRLFEISQDFPENEQERLVQPMVQSSRLVAVKIARGWQRRRFYEAFVAGLNEAEARSAETQTWIEFAVMAHYLDAETGQEIFAKYEEILANLRRLIDNADAWTF